MRYLLFFFSLLLSIHSLAQSDSLPPDTAFHLGKVVAYMSVDLSCDSFIPNCDSIQARNDSCFIEYLVYKHNEEDCRTGAKDCNIEIRVLPILVGPANIHNRPVPDDRWWLFALLTCQFVVIVYLQVAFHKNLVDTMKAYFNINLSQQLFREQEPSQPFSALLLNINFLLSFTVFVYLAVRHFLHPVASPAVLLSLTFLLIAGIYAVKYLVLRITAWIFPFHDELNFYTFNFFVNQKLLGVLLIPFNFLIAYSPAGLTAAFIFVSIAVVAIGMIVRSFRGLVIARNYIFSNKFHFFVYICTLEIAPVLIMVKLIIKGLH